MFLENKHGISQENINGTEYHYCTAIDKGTYITVEPNQTAESYVAGLK